MGKGRPLQTTRRNRGNGTKSNGVVECDRKEKRKKQRQMEKHLSAYKLLLDEYRHIGTADLTQLQRESNQAEQGTAVMLGMDKTSRRQTKRLIKRKMERELKILKRDFGITITHDHPVDKPVPEPEPEPSPSEADVMAMLLAKITELECK